MSGWRQFLKGALPALAVALVLVLSVALVLQPGSGHMGGQSSPTQNIPSGSIGTPATPGSPNSTMGSSKSLNLTAPTAPRTLLSYGSARGIFGIAPLNLDLVYVLLIALVAGLTVFVTLRSRYTKEF